jgi:SpoIID/LytB domain protein
MEEYDRISFSVQGDFDLVSPEGRKIESLRGNGEQWTVAPDQTDEARAVFSILTTAFADRDSADELRKKLTTGDDQARIVEIGEEIYIDGRKVADNLKFRVVVGRYATEREAFEHIDEYRDEFAPRVIRQIVRPATGTLDLERKSDNYSMTVDNGFRIIPSTPGCRVTLYDVREGTGFHWEREVDRIYPGIIEIRIDHRGLLMAFTEVTLETYLKGVVPSEMPASYPFEALKAQAIAARSEVLAKIGVKHPNDPFDLCAHVHCQAYTGCTNEDERASRAVEETRGLVLMYHKEVAEAVYSSSCGGHTEDKLNVWNPPACEHLQGGWDAADSIGEELEKLDLTTELGTKKWIAAKPKAWCNTAAFSGLPTILMRAESNFRWEVSYTRRELEDIIRRKTGDDIGQLIDIIPLSRGVSGRLMEIEIHGTKKNLRIQRELNIRATLSLKYLKSACFTIDVEIGEDARPVSFHFKGAGWGHGVGMCQVGAGVMASQNYTVNNILAHYYPGTSLERVYGG